MYETELSQMKENIQKVYELLEQKKDDSSVTPRFSRLSGDDKEFIHNALDTAYNDVVVPLDPEKVQAFDVNDEKWNVNIINESLEKAIPLFNDIYGDYVISADEYNKFLSDVYIYVQNISAVLNAEVSLAKAISVLENAFHKSNLDAFDVVDMIGDEKQIKADFSYADILELYSIAKNHSQHDWNDSMYFSRYSDAEEQNYSDYIMSQPKEQKNYSFSKSFNQAVKDSGVAGAMILIDTRTWHINIKFDGIPSEKNREFLKDKVRDYKWRGKEKLWQNKFSIDVVNDLPAVMQELGISEKASIVDIATGKTLSKDWKNELLDFAKMPYPKRMEYSASLPDNPMGSILQDTEPSNEPASVPPQIVEKVVEKVVEVEKKDDRYLSDSLGYYFQVDENTGKKCGIYEMTWNEHEQDWISSYLPDTCLGENLCNIKSWDEYFKENFTKVNLDKPFEMELLSLLKIVTDKMLNDTCREGKNIYSEKDNSLLFNMVNACFDACKRQDLQMFSLACSYVLYVEDKMFQSGLLVNKQSDFEIKLITDVCEDFVAKMEVYKRELPIFDFIDGLSNLESMEKFVLRDVATNIEDEQLDEFKELISEVNDYCAGKPKYGTRFICDLILNGDYREVVSEQSIQVASLMYMTSGKLDVHMAKDTLDKMCFGYYLKENSSLTQENAPQVVSDNKLLSMVRYDDVVRIDEYYVPYRPPKTCVGYAEFSYPLRKSEVDSLKLVPTHVSMMLSQNAYHEMKSHINMHLQKNSTDSPPLKNGGGKSTPQSDKKMQDGR